MFTSHSTSLGKMSEFTWLCLSLCPHNHHHYFLFKLGDPPLLGSKNIGYEYACISRYPWHVKNEVKNYCEKCLGSIIILKMVNDPLRAWKGNHSIPMFRCCFRIITGNDYILLVDDKKEVT